MAEVISLTGFLKRSVLIANLGISIPAVNEHGHLFEGELNLEASLIKLVRFQPFNVLVDSNLITVAASLSHVDNFQEGFLVILAKKGCEFNHFIWHILLD